MRRMIGLLCALCIACITIPGYAAEKTGNIKYNYKLSFEDESEFTNKYGWASAHPENPNFPDSMKPTASIVSDGKFGNAYQIINPFFYCDNYYGITWRVELKQMISPMPGAETERLLEYMMQVQNVNYWVKIPYSQTVADNVAANTRRTRMTLEAQVSDPTPENPDHLKSVSFRADVRLKNTDEWQYVQVPISCFKSGGLPITDYYDRIQRYRYLDFEFFNDKSFFGELPSPPVLNSDGTIDVPAESWNDRSKDVPILIDEMVLDRSVRDDFAYTKPSPGEEQNLSNANLKTIRIMGEEVNGLNINDKNEITVPLSPYVTSLTETDIECIPEIETIVSDLDATEPVISMDDKQVRIGASCDVILPESVPGTGKLLITSGDGLTCCRYILKVVHQEGLYAGIPKLEGVGTNGGLQSGTLRVAVPLFNANDEPRSAVVCAVITDAESGAVKELKIKQEKNITKAQSAEALLEINLLQEKTENYVLKLFIFDDLTAMNMITEPFMYGNTAQ